MYFPRLEIDLGKILHNSRLINDRCADEGISVVGITQRKNFLYSAVGDIISFNLNYFGLLSCMTSPYVKKVYNGR